MRPHAQRGRREGREAHGRAIDLDHRVLHVGRDSQGRTRRRQGLGLDAKATPVVRHDAHVARHQAMAFGLDLDAIGGGQERRLHGRLALGGGVPLSVQNPHMALHRRLDAQAAEDALGAQADVRALAAAGGHLCLGDAVALELDSDRVGPHRERERTRRHAPDSMLALVDVDARPGRITLDHDPGDPMLELAQRALGEFAPLRGPVGVVRSVEVFGQEEIRVLVAPELQKAEADVVHGARAGAEPLGAEELLERALVAPRGVFACAELVVEAAHGRGIGSGGRRNREDGERGAERDGDDSDSTREHGGIFSNGDAAHKSQGAQNEARRHEARDLQSSGGDCRVGILLDRLPTSRD